MNEERLKELERRYEVLLRNQKKTVLALEKFKDAIDEVEQRISRIVDLLDEMRELLDEKKKDKSLRYIG